MVTRTDIINALIKKYNYKTYLEIGVQKGKNFQLIECEEKTGVDPDPNSKATVFSTSDDFFKASIEENRKYDIIFVDGLHHSEQVHKDIASALLCLNEGGTIVCHDMKPTTEAMQRVPRVQIEWTGDCWKAWVKLRRYRDDLSMFVMDTDYGCGIIRKGSQQLLKINTTIEFDNLVKNYKEWLSLTPADLTLI